MSAFSCRSHPLTLLAAILACAALGAPAVAADCNGNGIDDQADLAAGTSADCNATGVPDECELSRQFTRASGPLTPFIGGVPLVFDLSSPPASLGDVTIGFRAFADVSAATEYADVTLDGSPIGSVFVTGAIDCPVVPNEDELIVGASIFNAAAEDGGVRIEIVATSDVEALCVPASFVEITVVYSTFQDCNTNGVPDECEPDCNLNGVPDDCDIDSRVSSDADTNGIPDECQQDCNSNSVPDLRELAAGSASDCNSNAVLDACDVATGAEADCNSNMLPDSCDLAAGTATDCNANAVPDACELSGQELHVAVSQNPNRSNGLYSDAACAECGSTTAQSLADNFVLADRAYVFGVNLWGAYFPPAGGLPEDDFTVIFHRSVSGLPQLPGLDAGAVTTTRAATGTSLYADTPEWRFALRFSEPLALGAGTWFIEIFNRTPNNATSFVWEFGDVATSGVAGLVYAQETPGLQWFRLRNADTAFELVIGRPGDCNGNGAPDICDIAAGSSDDCDGNGEPDECQPDCNDNGVADPCDIAFGTSNDCNGNGVPDTCDLRELVSLDCTNNGVPDECDIAQGIEQDCNGNGVPDRCEVESGRSEDCQSNGVPDECEPDSDHNGIIDDCEPVDADSDGVPDDIDECPGTGIGFAVDETGCPTSGPGPLGCGAGAVASLVMLAVVLPVIRRRPPRPRW